MSVKKYKQPTFSIFYCSWQNFKRQKILVLFLQIHNIFIKTFCIRKIYQCVLLMQKQLLIDPDILRSEYRLWLEQFTPVCYTVLITCSSFPILLIEVETCHGDQANLNCIRSSHFAVVLSDFNFSGLYTFFSLFPWTLKRKRVSQINRISDEQSSESLLRCNIELGRIWQPTANSFLFSDVVEELKYGSSCEIFRTPFDLFQQTPACCFSH